MCLDPRLKRTFALLKATLDRVQGLFSIRSTKRIAPFSARMRLWRHTGGGTGFWTDQRGPRVSEIPFDPTDPEGVRRTFQMFGVVGGWHPYAGLPEGHGVKPD